LTTCVITNHVDEKLFHWPRPEVRFELQVITSHEHIDRGVSTDNPGDYGVHRTFCCPTIYSLIPFEYRLSAPIKEYETTVIHNEVIASLTREPAASASIPPAHGCGRQRRAC